jgi:SAM-dependent methyltransferase
MLPDSLIGNIDDELGQPAQSVEDSASADTMNSFGYQWNTFSDVYSQWRNDFFDFVSPIDDAYFLDKSGLDVGCGMGRYTRVVGELGTEIIGMDLSNAVEAAFKNTHHLPEPRKGFDDMRQLAKPGGGILLWVYSETKHPIYTFIRRFTLRLTFSVLRAVCLVIAAMLWLVFIVPNKSARAVGLDSIADRFKFQRYSRFPFRALHTDLFDEFSAPVIHGHNEPEIRDWFQSSDCSGIVISSTGKHGWRGFGKS